MRPLVVGAIILDIAVIVTAAAAVVAVLQHDHRPWSEDDLRKVIVSVIKEDRAARKWVVTDRKWPGECRKGETGITSSDGTTAYCAYRQEGLDE